MSVLHKCKLIIKYFNHSGSFLTMIAKGDGGRGSGRDLLNLPVLF